MGRAYNMGLFIECTNCGGLGSDDIFKVTQLLTTKLDAETGAAKAALAGPHNHTGNLTDLPPVVDSTARGILASAASIDTRFELKEWTPVGGGGNHDGRFKGEQDYGSGYADWTHTVPYSGKTYEGQVWLYVATQPA